MVTDLGLGRNENKLFLQCLFKINFFVQFFLPDFIPPMSIKVPDDVSKERHAYDGSPETHPVHYGRENINVFGHNNDRFRYMYRKRRACSHPGRRASLWLGCSPTLSRQQRLLPYGLRRRQEDADSLGNY